MGQTTQDTFNWEEHMRKYPNLAKAISDYVHNNGCTCKTCQPIKRQQKRRKVQ